MLGIIFDIVVKTLQKKKYFVIWKDMQGHENHVGNILYQSLFNLYSN